MNNDRPPASKLRKWLMGNNESTLPGLIAIYLYPVYMYINYDHYFETEMLASYEFS